MQSLISLPSNLHNLLFRSNKHFLHLLSSALTTTSTAVSKPDLYEYFVNHGFSKSKAVSLSDRFSHVKSLDKLESVFRFFRDLGFTDSKIRYSINVLPQILGADIDRTLKPKIQFFQQLGLVGSDLSSFISRNTSLLSTSLENRLIPCTEILKKVLLNDNKVLLVVLRRCSWVIYKNPKTVLSRNIAILESYGIVNSQLSFLLRRQPRLFIVPEAKLNELASRVVDMGFSMKSRMFVHAFYSLSCLSEQTLEKKLNLFRSFDFSDKDIAELLKRAPALLRTSEEKLRSGIEFFLNECGLKKDVLIKRPTCLMFSMEERVVPRHKVVQLLQLKKKGYKLKRNLSLVDVLNLSEEQFLDKYISKFPDMAEELLVAYKGHLLDSDSASESEKEETVSHS